MFTTKEKLVKKTGPFGVGRFSYLQSLVTEFQDTDIMDMKQQVLANLANFAYDPVNYSYFRSLNVIELFIDTLNTEDEKLLEFAIGGLCNCSLDKENKDFIIACDCILTIAQCFSSTNEETVLSAMTTLMYLMTPKSRKDITSVPVVDAMLRFSTSKNPRIKNTATIFLEDYCTTKDIQVAKDAVI